MVSEEALIQIDAALDVAGGALQESEDEASDPLGSILRRTRSDRASEAITICASTVSRLTASRSIYEQQTKRVLDRKTARPSWQIGALMGVLQALRRDLEAGYLLNVTEELHADVFGDFLSMAGQLSKDGYHLAAAVTAGAALEAQLRAIADRAGVSTSIGGKPKRAGTLNDELAKREIYRKSEQKQVLAWQDLRNNAAHGQDEFSAAEVRLMVQGIRDFVARHPA